MSIPSNWVLATLGDIRMDAGSTIDPRREPLSQFVLYSVPQFDCGKPDIVTGEQIGSSKQTVAPGTVLLCKINPRINRVWVVPTQSNGRIIASTEWIPFFPVAGIESKYLAYFLQQSEVRDYLAHNVSGVGGSLMRVRPSVVDQLNFRWAPEREQDRIVAEIDKQFTRLDAAIAALKRAQANLKRYRASVLKAACEGRLVPTEAELARKEGRDYEPASELLKRILAERRAKWEAGQLQKMIAADKPSINDAWKRKYGEPTPPDTSVLPELPEGWIWTSFDQLITFGPQNGIYKPSTAYGSGTRIVRIDDYQDDSFKAPDELRQLILDETESRLYALEAGDILINRVNSPSHLGKCCIVNSDIANAVFESNMMRLRPALGVQAHFLACYLRSIEGKRRLTSNAKWAVNQASINQQDVTNTPVPLPPLKEQFRISAELDRRITTIDHIRAHLLSKLASASQLRSAILKSAFSGKLICQDPNDEPASVLLERIRAERASAQAANGKNHKALMTVIPAEAQRRRRVKKLAQSVRAGKG